MLVFFLPGKCVQRLCRGIGGKAACLQEPPLALPFPRAGGGRRKSLLQNCQGTFAFVLTFACIGIKHGSHPRCCGFRIETFVGKGAQDARPPPFFGPGAGETFREAQIRLQPL